MRFIAHQVLYYDKSCGVPQIGHFVANATNEADQEFFANEDTEHMLDITARSGHILEMQDATGFMGRIPRILAN